ncbi:hypothetical protein XO12_07105 [Marinitoga sp. 1154]|uniref:cohesin domain-containing protein n=1 Tax=Marinitoga sp. 1154 TaxID=1643335 RepID=UPI001586569C|nr:PQQ-binding-like beta-propeller repeat protein [Marinitoga sp. 1154]NUU99869.1 hypothetical protein [Marinitoga sp. 1154]
MKKINILIFLIIIFLLQGCIFKNQPPIIESLTPSNNEKINPDNVIFQWIAKDPEKDLLSYNFYLFSNGVKIKEVKNLAINSYKIDKLEEGKKYYWKIEAVDIKGNKSSKEANFETIEINNKPIKSFLIYPENNNNNVYPYNIKFQWNKSIDFDGDNILYNLYISDSTPLTTPIATNLSKNEYIIDKLELGKKYYWKVETFDSYGATALSDIWTFKTSLNTPPIIDFPSKTYTVKEGEEFELNLDIFVSDMEDKQFEYQILTNNGAYIQGNTYIFKPGYDFVKHDNTQKKIQEKILVSDTKDSASGFLNIIVKDVNRNPDMPSIEYPAKNSIVPSDITLKWTGSDPDGDNLTYDIYIGNYTKNYTKIATNITSTEFPLQLNPDTNYYLKIVAKDNYNGIKASDELYFKTKKSPDTIQWESNISNIKDIFMFDNKLIAISENSVYKLNTDNSIDRSIELEGLKRGSILYKNLLFIPDYAGNINIINLRAFNLENTIQISEAISGIVASENYKNEENLYVITSNGILYVYDIKTGLLKWKKSYNIIPDSPPVIIENGYIVLSGNLDNKGKIIITKPKGKISKELSLDNVITTNISNDEDFNLYFGEGVFLHSYKKDGTKNWTINLPENINGEILYDGEFLYACGQNNIFKLNKMGDILETYSTNDIFPKTMIISENKNLYVLSNNGIFKNSDKILSTTFNDIKTYALLNDGLLYFATDEKLYAISIEEKNILKDLWAVYGKNPYRNRDSYIRNNTRPDIPTLIYPQNQSIEIPVTVNLEWNAEDPEDDSLSFDIYLGENDNLEYITTTQSTSYELTLENDKKYFWKIIANDGEIESESQVFAFNTVPEPAKLKFKTYVEGAIIYSPAISDENYIYFSTSSGKVYAYDSYGNEIWSFNTDGFINSPVVINPLNQIIVGNDNGNLYIINSDGTLYEKIKLDSAINKPVSLGTNSEIFVITDIGTIYKLGAFGNEIWKRNLNGAPTTNIVVDKENNIYFGINNHLYSYNSDGEERFKLSFQRVIITGLTMDENENLYFATADNKIYSYNRSGQPNFKKQIDEKIINYILLGNDKSLYFETDTGTLYKYYYYIDHLEKLSLGGYPYTLILMEDTKYITTDEKFIVYNGEMKWYKDYKKIRHSPNIDNNGVIIFGTIDGYLYGIYGQSLNLLDSSWPIYLGDKKHTGNIDPNNISIPSNRPPLKPYNPYPTNKSEISAYSVALSWESSDPDGDNVYYDVYFGDLKDQTLKISKISQKYYNISNLTPGTYYWYITAYDDYGNISKSDLWQFTINEIINENNPPLKPVLLEPINNAQNISTNVMLKWEGSDPDNDPLTYDIYISSDPILSTPVETNYSGNTYNINLEMNQTYYWKIVAKDGKGGETPSDTFSFTTSQETNNPPNKPILLEPLNNAQNVDPDITLSWSATDPDNDPLSYDLYLGTNQNLTEPYKINLTTTSFNVSNLELGQTYYWKVIVKDGKGGINTSDTYSFTVRESIGPLTPKLYFKDAIVTSGQQGEFIIHGQKLENILAFDIEIDYDNTKLSISQSGIQAIGELTGRSLIININNGKLKITTLSFSPFTINDSDIIKITFTAIGGRGNTEVKFTNNTRIVDPAGNELDVDIADIGIITIQ